MSKVRRWSCDHKKAARNALMLVGPARTIATVITGTTTKSVSFFVKRYRVYMNERACRGIFRHGRDFIPVVLIQSKAKKGTNYRTV